MTRKRDSGQMYADWRAHLVAAAGAVPTKTEAKKERSMRIHIRQGAIAVAEMAGRRVFPDSYALADEYARELMEDFLARYSYLAEDERR